MMSLATMLAEGSFPGGPLLWVLVFLVGVAVVVLMLKRHARRSAIFDDPRRQTSAEEELRHSMDRLLIELQEASREINATIDTKTAVLNKLIADADRRIETLKALEKNAPPSAAAGPAEPPLTEEARRRAALERDILRLAGEGKTELEIARLTGLPRGEVELVLSLRRMPGTEGGARP